MPYIKKEDRAKYDKHIKAIVDQLQGPTVDDAKGHMNYIISSLIVQYIRKIGLRYNRINDFIGGVLSCCQMELYRIVAIDYEEKAKDKNGDLDATWNPGK